MIPKSSLSPIVVFLAATLVPAGLSSAADPDALPEIECAPFASDLVAPLFMVPYGEEERGFLVAEQNGVISFLGEDGGKPGEVFLDLRDRMVELNDGFDERGLIGLVLHPDFEENRKFYVFYSAPLREGAPDDFNHTGHLSEFKTLPDGSAGDPASERVLLAIDEPQFNHDGGNLLFGVDGFLYVCVGDGGGAHDLGVGHAEGGNGQALDRLLGKILRIDVDSGDPYGIPEDNPLVGKDGRDEIFAWGLRNPWGITLDEDGSIIAADVGQNRFEEVDVIRRGENYGWPVYEAFAEFDQKNPIEVVALDPGATASGFVMPVLAYPHTASFGEAAGYGISVTGGHVYRGKAIPELDGVYVFGDWNTSWGTNPAGLFAGVPVSEDRWEMTVLPGSDSPADDPAWITGFARDRDGEIYVLTHGSTKPEGKTGAIWKIVPSAD
ncbi:MAG: PQQ-dependent sugar dehydrogenase [Verrucomicrobiales bacterium]